MQSTITSYKTAKQRSWSAHCLVGAAACIIILLAAMDAPVIMVTGNISTLFFGVSSPCGQMLWSRCSPGISTILLIHSHSIAQIKSWTSCCSSSNISNFWNLVSTETNSRWFTCADGGLSAELASYQPCQSEWEIVTPALIISLGHMFWVLSQKHVEI